jgi:cytochrome b561
MISSRYSKLIISLHWSTALVVIIAYLISEGESKVRAHPPMFHFIFGMAVLMLLVPRVASRVLFKVPPARAIGGKWLQFAASIGHWTLYLLLVAVPMTGWYAVSRLGIRVSVYGFILPPIAATSGSPGPLAGLHQVGGNLLIIFAGIHTALALWHHFVLRDTVLRRMSPF